MITAHRLIDEQERFFKELRYNKDRFRDFLGTMAAHYRQPVHRQVALFFHAPATGRAYADAALWERLGMKVRKGAEGVPVLTEDGAVSYVYDVSELQDKEQAAAHRLLWSYDEKKDGAALRKVFGAPSEKNTIDAVVDGMASLAAQGFGQLEILGASYLVLWRLGLDAEEALGLALILAPYEKVDAALLLGNIQKAAMKFLDPLAKEIRAREQLSDERMAGDEGHTHAKANGASDGTSDEGGGSAQGNRGAGRRDHRSDEHVLRDGLSVPEARIISGGTRAIRSTTGSDGGRSTGEAARAGGTGGSSRGRRGTAGTGTLGADSQVVSPVVSTEGVAGSSIEQTGKRVPREGGARDTETVSGDVPEGGSTADPREESALLAGGAVQSDDRSADSGDPHRRSFLLEERPIPAVDFSAIDYEADMQTTRGKRAVFQRNLAAVLVLKNIEREGRSATEEEQKLLRSYSGFGGLSEVFDPINKTWEKEYDALRETLTNEEYCSARSSILNAYYTPPDVVDAIYQGLQHIGFGGGNILEPSCGAGRFFTVMPDEMRTKSHICGVELDALSARIAAAAHPDVMVTAQGFETTRFADGSFDLAIGNVPFGDTPIVTDPKYSGAGLLPHDYFLMKMLDEVRPGGLIAVITSSGTMDKLSERIRKDLSARADLVIAMRLPSTTFAGAGASVTSDILLLRKHGGTPTSVEVHTPVGHDLRAWQTSRMVYRIGKTLFKEAHAINHYFTQHPSHVLGTWVERKGRHGAELSVTPHDNTDLKDEIINTFKELAQNSVYLSPKTPLPIPVQAKEPDAHVMGFYVTAGTLTFIDANGASSSPKLSEEIKSHILSAVLLRDAGHAVLEVQQRSGSDEELYAAQKVLRDLYDSHVKNYGFIARDRTLANVFSTDPGYNFIRAYELKDDKGNVTGKADIFSQRTILPEVRPEYASTPEDALIISIQQKGAVDLPYMSALCGLPIRTMTDTLEFSHLYFDEQTKTYIQADEYLSGDIRAKMDVLEEQIKEIGIERDRYLSNIHVPKDQMAAHHDEHTELLDQRLLRAQKNYDALHTVLPQEIEIGQISVGLGTSWLKPAYVEEFVKALGLRKVQVDYVKEAGEWRLAPTERLSYQMAAETQYAAGGKSAYTLLDLCLNQRNAEVKVPSKEDPEKKVVDAELTTQAQMKQQELRDKFRSWLLSDPTRVKEIQEYYNRRFNSVRLRTYDGEKLTFPGMTNTIALKPHQKAAIAHSLFGGNTLFAHCVGAGKTFEMVAAIMESKRMGLSHKAMMVVPNHLTAQTGEEFQRLYPGAKILVARKKDFEKKNRQEFISRIATQNLDAVIIGASSFEKIKLSAEREADMYRRDIRAFEEKLYTLRSLHPKDFSVRKIETLLAGKKSRLKKLEQSNRKEMDDVIAFEELGIDKLVIDEAHEFKNLEIQTRHARVAGVGTTTHVQKTWDLYLKTQYINEMTGCKGLIFATGTPISNTMTELFTMQRYLAPDKLKQLELDNFDAWVGAFADITVNLELRPEGAGYQLKERFSGFRNLPELMTMFKEFADVQTSDMLKGEIKVPTAEIIIDKEPASMQQKELIKELIDRADAIRRRMPQDVMRVDGTPTKDSMLLITHAGRALSLDPRLILPEAADEPRSKVNRCVKNLIDTYHATGAERGTQILFCDESTSTGTGKGKFNIYDDIRTKLIKAGIPREEIAIVQEVADKDKQTLFDKVRSGTVRILIGSTGTLGVGTNVQDRLAALHDLSVPWPPADLMQRMGRIIRPGNLYDRVKIFRYVTEGTFDAYLWQTVENKQKQIVQIMTSKTPLRSIQDLDETVLSYAELKAIATGNPFLREKMELENRLGRIQIAKADFETTRQKLQQFAALDGPARLKEQDAKIADLMTDKLCMDRSYLQDTHGKELFQMTLCGNIITDRNKAAAMLHQAAQGGFSATKDFQGEYRGLKLKIHIDPIAMAPYILLMGKRNHSIAFADKPETTIRRITALHDGIAKEICKVQEERTRIAADVKEAEEKSKKPFPHAAEEAEKKARLIEIIHQMEAASGDVVAARDTLSYKKTGEASAAEYDVPVYVR